MFFLQIKLSESRFIQRQLIDWSMGRVIFGGAKCHKCQQLLSRTHAIECSRAREILQPLRPFLDIYDSRSLKVQGNIISTFIRTFNWIYWRSKRVKVPDRYLLPMDQLGLEMDGLATEHFTDLTAEEYCILGNRFTRRAVYLIAEAIIDIKRTCLNSDISMPVIKFPSPLVPEIDQLDHQELLPSLLMNSYPDPP